MLRENDEKQIKEYIGGFTPNPRRGGGDQQGGGQRGGGGTTAPQNSPVQQPLDAGGPLRRVQGTNNLAGIRGQASAVGFAGLERSRRTIVQPTVVTI